MSVAKSYYFPAKSLALANYLINHGCEIKKVKDTDTNPKFKTFFFVRTPKLEELVDRYTKEKEESKIAK